MAGRDDGLSPGDHGDPVADSIRAQQNRDAMPTQDEAKQMAREALRREGCTECGESDPDNLQEVGLLLPECPVVQTPPEPFVVYCDDCLEGRETLRERGIRKAKKRADTVEPDTDAVVFFECQNWEYATDDSPDYSPPGYGTLTGPLECRCGAHVEDVVYLDGGDA